MTKTMPIRPLTPAANTNVALTFQKYSRLLKIAAIRAANGGSK